LHIAEAFDPGGVVWWLADLNRELPRTEVAADFLALGGRGVRAEEVEESGSHVEPFTVSPRELILGDQVSKAIARQPYDVVHSHIFNLSGWLLRHAHRLAVPVRIAHFHTTHDGRPPTVATRWRRAVSRSLISRYANVALGCSGAALETAPRLHKEIARAVVRYGVDPSRFVKQSPGTLRRLVGVGDDVPLIGHVGRFTEAKNHRGLIRIFEAVLDSLMDAHLVLIGDGELFTEIRDLASRQPFHARIHFLGARTDVSEMLADLDVVAFPSWWEGFGIALVEGRFAGVPVVASDLPSIREALAGDDGHVLEDPRDVDRFAAAIVRVVTSGRGGAPDASWVSQSSTATSAARLLDVYRSAVARCLAA